MLRLVAAIVVLVALPGQGIDPQALQRMVAAERAFAAATADIGIRDGFLAFLAHDAVELVPGPTGAEATVDSAVERLRARDRAQLPLAARLMWEPFTGQVSADGSLGWLTGGYANVSQQAQTLLDHGAYFRVWTRRSDGTWRVWLDLAVTLPRLWQDASPFRVAPDPGAGSAGTPSESLLTAERAVAGGGDAWHTRLSESVRLHREGQMPFVGRDVTTDVVRSTWQTVRYTVVRSTSADSDDLAVVLGGYDAATAAGAEHGIWGRVWKRDVTGRWRIVFETSKAR
jgi:hypothetical protein